MEIPICLFVVPCTASSFGWYIKGNMDFPIINISPSIVYQPEMREEKRGRVNIGNLVLHILCTVICLSRCRPCSLVTVVRMPDVCQGLTRHG